MIEKIVSGGQTGADQAALDTALKLDIPHGGWIPKGRMTEKGRLPDKYRLHEMPGRDYAARTKQNVIDSDGTLILSHGELAGGSAYTKQAALTLKRACLHVDLDHITEMAAVEEIEKWIAGSAIRVLNVAGPRASKDPRIYGAACDVLEAVLYLDLAGFSTLRHLRPENQAGSAEANPDLPKTLSAAVKRLASGLTHRQKSLIANFSIHRLTSFGITLEPFLRQEFRLGAGNEDLLESCRIIARTEPISIKTACLIITKALKEHLRKRGDMLRIVK